MDEDIDLDYFNMSDAQINVLVTTTNLIRNYLIEEKEVKESIKETLDNMAEDLGIERKTKTFYGSAIKKAATISLRKTQEKVNYQAQVVDSLVDKIDKTAVDNSDGDDE